MRTFIFLLIASIIVLSCKKEEKAVPQQQMTLIDFESRVGVANASVKCMKDEIVQTPLGQAILTKMKQKVNSDNAGVATFDFIDGGYVFIEANDYLTRRLSMQNARGAQEMLKSAAIELDLINDHINSGTITQVSISQKADPQLSSTMRESLNLLDTAIQFPNSSSVIQFDGIANRENSFVITIFGDNIRDSTIHVTPVHGVTNKVEFKY